MTLKTGGAQNPADIGEMLPKMQEALPRKQVNIMGIRGIPAAHGGFETFAAQLAPYLRDRGWQVNVYCQLEPTAAGYLAPDFEDKWEGIKRIHLGTRHSGSAGSMIFDWRCITDVQGRDGVDLILGYNTAVFTVVSKLRGRRVLMNMDGVEWRRAKWSLPIKAWFYLNEFIGANIATVPIADHPEISRHLRRHGCRRAEVIPYGSDVISSAPSEPVSSLGLEPGKYLISVARIEPENSILEIVRAFSAVRRKVKLVVLGRLEPDNDYHNAVRQAASQGVSFPGAIYDKPTVAALRFHCLAYLHGHQVGGTNPSLVEAMGAGNPIIAHDNVFNRWVAGPEQFYFRDEASLAALLDDFERGGGDVNQARSASRSRHGEAFRIEGVNRQYEALLENLL